MWSVHVSFKTQIIQKRNICVKQSVDSYISHASVLFSCRDKTHLNDLERRSERRGANNFTTFHWNNHGELRVFAPISLSPHSLDLFSPLLTSLLSSHCRCSRPGWCWQYIEDFSFREMAVWTRSELLGLLLVKDGEEEHGAPLNRSL